MPLWVRTILLTGPLDEVQKAIPGHYEHLRGLAARGRLRAAGAFKRGEGFLEIFEADDLYEAEAVARQSPLVEEGLGSWMVREWTELAL